MSSLEDLAPVTLTETAKPIVNNYLNMILNAA
jgi:hypothetical protein